MHQFSGQHCEAKEFFGKPVPILVHNDERGVRAAEAVAGAICHPDHAAGGSGQIPAINTQYTPIKTYS